MGNNAADRQELAWLDSLRRELALTTDKAARTLWPSPEKGQPAFFNYRLEHVRQVERDALSLLEKVGGDQEIVLASVWVHDWYQPLFFSPDHGLRAAAWAAERLAERGFPPAKVDAVCFAVAVHSSEPGSIPSEAHEARLLWDADKLSHLGAHEVLTRMFNNLALDRLCALCADPAFPEQTFTIRDLAQVRMRRLGEEVIDTNRFYFAPSRAWGAERLHIQKAFCASLCRQVGLE
jgi:hypothetical protein